MDSIFYQIEYAILNAVQHLRFGLLDRVMIAVSWLGNSGMIWIALVLFLLFRRRYKTATCIALALIFSLLAVNLAVKPLVMRERPLPYLTTLGLKGIEPIIPLPSESSFPSGHSSSSFAAATAFFCCDQRFGKYALWLAAVIAFSRLYLYVHFLTDVLAGSLIGIILGLIACKLVKQVNLPKLNDRR